LASEAHDPVDCYRGALAAGDALLEQLHEPLDPHVLERIEELVNRREALILAAGAMIAESGGDGHLRPALQVLIEQQRSVEAQFMEALMTLRASAGRAQAARTQASAVRKLLGRQVRPGSLDERG
jgi:hypothetical protein